MALKRTIIASSILAALYFFSPPAGNPQLKTIDSSNATLTVDFCYSKKNGIFVQRAGQVLPVRWRAEKSDTFPALSPSGKMLAFTLGTKSKVNMAGSRFIVIQEGPGAKPRIVYGTENHHCFKPTWSPDGKMLLFNNLKDMWGVSVINIDGSGYRDIIFPNTQNGMIDVACWSSDGRSIFASDFVFLYIVDLNGKIIKKIAFKELALDVRSSGATFSLSPDGNRLLMAVTVELPDMDQFEFPVDVIYMLDLRANKATRISPKGVLASSPVWLPDGKSFLFYGSGKFKEGIYRMEIESSRSNLIIPGASNPSVSHLSASSQH
jgi:TolB protein